MLQMYYIFLYALANYFKNERNRPISQNSQKSKNKTTKKFCIKKKKPTFVRYS